MVGWMSCPHDPKEVVGMSQQQQHSPAGVGGLVVSWVLGQPVRGYVSKKTSTPGTIVELRDPARLGNSLTVFLDGEPGALASIAPNTLVTLRLESVSAGRRYGELTGRASRVAVEAAFGAVAESR
jgi:hypothetical protein